MLGKVLLHLLVFIIIDIAIIIQYYFCKKNKLEKATEIKFYRIVFILMNIMGIIYFMFNSLNKL